MSLAVSFQQVAPFYNLALVLVAFFLFGRLFLIKKRGSFLLPWKVFCGALAIYLLIQVLTILKFAEILSYPLFVNGLLELVMVSLFIYVLLIQKEHIEIQRGKKPHQIKIPLNKDHSTLKKRKH